MADDSRCQNCGNTGRFTVSVTNPAIDGQTCRNACSRMCAHILADNLMRELEVSSNYRAKSAYEIRPQWSGAYA